MFQETREDLLRFGQVRGRNRRAWLGVFTDNTPAGLVVAGIVPRSPAAESGIREGDLIRALNFREVANRQGLYRELWKHAAGATIRVAIVRKGQSLTIAVTSADRAEFYR